MQASDGLDAAVAEAQVAVEFAPFAHKPGVDGQEGRGLL